MPATGVVVEGVVVEVAAVAVGVDCVCVWYARAHHELDAIAAEGFAMKAIVKHALHHLTCFECVRVLQPTPLRLD